MPESMFSMAGIDVQHRSEWVFTFDRNRRSRWAGIRTNRDLPNFVSRMRSTAASKSNVGLGKVAMPRRRGVP